jgi:hypothetical protein
MLLRIVRLPMAIFTILAALCTTSMMFFFLSVSVLVECSALQYMHKNNFRGGFIVTS